MTMDPSTAAINALVSYLQTALPTYTIVEGWPEDNVNATTASPLVSITEISTDEERLSPYDESEEDVDENTVKATYVVSELTVNAQLDVWVSHKAKLPTVRQAIQAAFANNLPNTSDLWLENTEYFDRPLVVELGQCRPGNDSNQAPKGQWRLTWDVTLYADVIATENLPKTKEVANVVETELSDITLEETFITEEST